MARAWLVTSSFYSERSACVRELLELAVVVEHNDSHRLVRGKRDAYFVAQLSFDDIRLGIVGENAVVSFRLETTPDENFKILLRLGNSTLKPKASNSLLKELPPAL